MKPRALATLEWVSMLPAVIKGPESHSKSGTSTASVLYLDRLDDVEAEVS